MEVTPQEVPLVHELAGPLNSLQMMEALLTTPLLKGSTMHISSTSSFALVGPTSPLTNSYRVMTGYEAEEVRELLPSLANLYEDVRVQHHSLNLNFSLTSS